MVRMGNRCVRIWLFCFCVGSVAMTLYRYFGLKFGHLTERVAINAAVLVPSGAHVAVWAGINGPRNSAWVQGGIEQMGWQDKPHIYIEVGRNGRQTSFKDIEIDYGKVAVVKLRRYRNFWRVTVKCGNKTLKSHEIPIERPTAARRPA